MQYELYYWPEIPGRGEFVRLALEQGDADYVDVARMSEKDGMGVPAMMRLMKEAPGARLPYAPPFLKAGKQIVAQTALILHFLGPKLGLAPKAEAARLWAHQLQLTIADFLVHIHDTHHPIAGSLYYEEQKPEAKRRAEKFRAERLPKFLGYFEKVLSENGARRMIGRSVTYVDLSMFQVIAGLGYAFPQALNGLSNKCPRLMAHHQQVRDLPRIAAYLKSERRLAFNQQCLFRHYPELDGEAE